jgi:hypothetical protein
MTGTVILILFFKLLHVSSLIIFSRRKKTSASNQLVTDPACNHEFEQLWNLQKSSEISVIAIEVVAQSHSTQSQHIRSWIHSKKHTCNIFVLQDLEERIVNLESSSDHCLQRSSQLMSMITRMSVDSFCVFHDRSEEDVSCSLSDELDRINPDVAEMSGHQHDAFSEIDGEPSSDKKLTKLQQMLKSSSFSSSFLKNETHVAHVESASPRPVLTSLGDVNDEPSKRAASLLLSRSSATGLQSPQLEVKQTIPTQLWNGSKICDDLYDTTIF